MFNSPRKLHTVLGHLLFIIAIAIIVLPVYLAGLPYVDCVLFCVIVFIAMLPCLNIINNFIERKRLRRESTFLSPERIDLLFRAETLDKLISQTFEKFLDMLNTASGVIIIQNISTHQFEIYEQSRSGRRTIKKNEFVSSDSSLLKIFSESKRTIIKKNLDPQRGYDARIINDLEWYGAEIASPVIYDERILGVLLVGGRNEKYTAREIEIIRSFSSKIGIVYMNGFLWKEAVLKKDIEKEFDLGKRMQDNFNPPFSGTIGGYDFCLSLHRGHGTYRQYCDLYSELGDLSLMVFTNNDMTPGSFVFLPSIIPLAQVFFRQGMSSNEIVKKLNKIIEVRGLSDVSVPMMHFRFSGKKIEWAGTGYGQPLVYDSGDGGAFSVPGSETGGKIILTKNQLIFVFDENITANRQGYLDVALSHLKTHNSKTLVQLCEGIADDFENLSGKRHFIGALRSAR